MTKYQTSNFAPPVEAKAQVCHVSPSKGGYVFEIFLLLFQDQNLPLKVGTCSCVCGCDECGKVVWQIAGARSLCTSPTSPNWALLRLVRKAERYPNNSSLSALLESLHISMVPNMADSSPKQNKKFAKKL